MQMNKFGGAFANSTRQPPGSEPGVDPKRATAHALYSRVHELCEIEVVDYSASTVEFNQYDNQGFIQLLQATQGRRPSWAKVRWINIAGVSWDVLSSLALACGMFALRQIQLQRFPAPPTIVGTRSSHERLIASPTDLHPLTLENILHGRRTSRSKADYYQKWLFIHILCQSLADSQSGASPLQQTLDNNEPRVVSPVDMSAIVSPLAQKISLQQGKPENGDPEKGKIPKFKRENTEMRREAAENRIRAADIANDALRKTATSVNVQVKNLFIFLGKDGTVISIHQADRGFGDPIHRRLRQRDGILRSTGDASLLLQALLDLGGFTNVDRSCKTLITTLTVVDRAIDIVDRFHESILKIERDVLIRPKVQSIRDCARHLPFDGHFH
jgi:Mg2+ and Co2+ transporter CorA